MDIETAYQLVRNGTRYFARTVDEGTKIQMGFVEELNIELANCGGIYRGTALEKIRIFATMFEQIKLYPTVANHILDEHPEISSFLVSHRGNLPVLCVDEASFKKVTFLISQLPDSNGLSALELLAIMKRAEAISQSLALEYSGFYGRIIRG